MKLPDQKDVKSLSHKPNDTLEVLNTNGSQQDIRMSTNKKMHNKSCEPMSITREHQQLLSPMQSQSLDRTLQLTATRSTKKNHSMFYYPKISDYSEDLIVMIESYKAKKLKQIKVNTSKSQEKQRKKVLSPTRLHYYMVIPSKDNKAYHNSVINTTKDNQKRNDQLIQQRIKQNDSLKMQKQKKDHQEFLEKYKQDVNKEKHQKFINVQKNKMLDSNPKRSNMTTIEHNKTGDKKYLKKDNKYTGLYCEYYSNGQCIHTLRLEQNRLKDIHLITESFNELLNTVLNRNDVDINISFKSNAGEDNLTMINRNENNYGITQLSNYNSVKSILSYNNSHQEKRMNRSVETNRKNQDDNDKCQSDKKVKPMPIMAEGYTESKLKKSTGSSLSVSQSKHEKFVQTKQAELLREAKAAKGREMKLRQELIAEKTKESKLDKERQERREKELKAVKDRKVQMEKDKKAKEEKERQIQQEKEKKIKAIKDKERQEAKDKAIKEEDKLLKAKKEKEEEEKIAKERELQKQKEIKVCETKVQEEKQDKVIKELQLKELQLKEEQLKEEQLKEEQLKEQELKEQQLKEQKLKEQLLKEEQLKEQQLKEQQLKELELKEQQFKEQELKEQQIKELKLKELELKELELKELELKEQQLKDQELKEQQMKEQQLKEQQIKEQELKELELKEQQIKEQQLKEQQLKEQQEKEIKEKIIEEAKEKEAKEQLSKQIKEQEEKEKEEQNINNNQKQKLKISRPEELNSSLQQNQIQIINKPIEISMLTSQTSSIIPNDSKNIILMNKPHIKKTKPKRSNSFDETYTLSKQLEVEEAEKQKENIMKVKSLRQKLKSDSTIASNTDKI